VLVGIVEARDERLDEGGGSGRHGRRQLGNRLTVGHRRPDPLRERRGLRKIRFGYPCLGVPAPGECELTDRHTLDFSLIIVWRRGLMRVHASRWRWAGGGFRRKL
jgi:hypothetical protein